MYGLAAAVPIFWVAIFVYSPAGVFNPSLMGVMSKRVGPSGQGRLQGATSSLMGIAGMLGPGLFTLSFAWAIRPTSPIHLPGLPFLIAALLFASAGVLAMRSTVAGQD
jgi:DHA1 family tetracycline resistance protein-like MFS transporter